MRITEIELNAADIIDAAELYDNDINIFVPSMGFDVTFVDTGINGFDIVPENTDVKVKLTEEASQLILKIFKNGK